MKKKYLLMICMAILFVSCAEVYPIVFTETAPCGFWSGLLHGIISPFSFIGSLISDDIAMYATNNNGGWYDFGFLFGVGGLASSSIK
jgi:hypothetical protein